MCFATHSGCTFASQELRFYRLLPTDLYTETKDVDYASVSPREMADWLATDRVLHRTFQVPTISTDGGRQPEKIFSPSAIELGPIALSF